MGTPLSNLWRWGGTPAPPARTWAATAYLRTTDINEDLLDAAALAQLAELAKLNIPATDLAEVGSRIDNVLRLVDQLKAADLSGVAPMAHPLDAEQRLRPDQVTEADARESLQAIAPAVEAGLYLVPKVID